MTIQIDSLQDVLVFILSGIAVLGIVATVHWTMFAAPLLKKMIDPIAFGLKVTSRVVKQRHPVEFSNAERDLKSEMELGGRS